MILKADFKSVRQSYLYFLHEIVLRPAMPQKIALRQNADKNFIGRQNIKLRRRGSAAPFGPLRLPVAAGLLKFFGRFPGRDDYALFGGFLCTSPSGDEGD